MKTISLRTRLARWPAAAAAAALVAACGGGGDGAVEREGTAGVAVPTPSTIRLERIGAYEGGVTGAAEITAYDARTQRLFVVNGANGTVDVLSLKNPARPTLLSTLSVADLGAGVNSVAIHDGVAALAVAADPKTAPGLVVLVNTASLKRIDVLEVGALPDMLTFTPDGKHLLVANEGEPNSYGQPDSVDPEGSISVIEVRRNGKSVVRTADFKAWVGREDELRAQGVRIFGPGANAAQDLEPEYIAVSADGKTAWVTLQENNAVAVIDVERAVVTAVKPLGVKDHNVVGAGLDASDRDGGINIRPWPVFGMYQPDAIASYVVDGRTYLVTANEGDERTDWPGFNDRTTVADHCGTDLSATFGPDATQLGAASNLGRLRITNTPNGGWNGKNELGQCTALYVPGARSFSIWNADASLVWDSGDQFEQLTKALPNVQFNADNEAGTNELDARSRSKGPEPEGVTIGRFGSRTFAFVGLERVGGVMVYDVSVPAAPFFATYLNTRDGEGGDLGPEGLTLIDGRDSPNGRPLLIVGHEVSGTTTVLQINLE